MRKPVVEAFLAGVAVVAVAVAALLLAGALGNGTQTGHAATTPASPLPNMPAAADSGSTAIDATAIYHSESSGVVLIVSTFGNGGGSFFGGSGTGQALGSGFVVSPDGYILTNAHVVMNNGRRAVSVSVSFKRADNQTKQVKGSIVGIDRATDVALLKVDPRGLTLDPLQLGDSDSVVVGEPVVAIGNPLGYDFSISAGIISGTGRNLPSPSGAIIANGIQTDAAINPGNSGGPLLDGSGRVIGVNEQIASQSGGFSGLGFAVPINTAKSVMEQLINAGTVEHAFLGIEGQTIDVTVADVLKLPVKQGVLVARVQPGTAAAKARLRGGDRTVNLQGIPFIVGGDIITTLGDEPLTSMQQLAAAISQKKPGDRITLTVLRNGEAQDISVTLGNRPGGQ